MALASARSPQASPRLDEISGKEMAEALTAAATRPVIADTQDLTGFDSGQASAQPTALDAHEAKVLGIADYAQKFAARELEAATAREVARELERAQLQNADAEAPLMAAAGGAVAMASAGRSNMAGASTKIDPVAYAEAVARVEAKFAAQGKSFGPEKPSFAEAPFDEADQKSSETTADAKERQPDEIAAPVLEGGFVKSRMTERLSGAIREEKERNARIASATRQRTALMAERNSSATLHALVQTSKGAANNAPKSAGLRLDGGKQKLAAANLKSSLFTNVKSLGGTISATGSKLANGLRFGAERGASATASIAKASIAKAGVVASKPMSAMRTPAKSAASVMAKTLPKGMPKTVASGTKKVTGMTSKSKDTQVSASSGDPKRSFGPVLLGFGALCSLVFVALISVWTYKLGQRDSMAVPIVQAMAGDVRVRPENPGGRQVPHQGLAVNEVLNGGGVEEVAETVMTAPRRRVFATEDRPVGELLANAAAAQAEEATTTAQTTLVVGTNVSAPADATTITASLAEPGQTAPQLAARAEDVADALPQASVLSARARLAAGSSSEPLAPQNPSLSDQDTSVGPAPSELASSVPNQGPAVLSMPKRAADEIAILKDADTSAPTRIAALASPPAGVGSLRAPVVLKAPRARPENVSTAIALAVDDALATALAEAAAPAAQTTRVQTTPAQTATTRVASTNNTNTATAPAAAPVMASDLSTIPLPVGTRMIQLGAFDSAQTAQTEWARFSQQHSDLLGSKRSYIQRIDNSGRVFYRLRVAGYDNLSQTRAACAALSARGLPCITATLR